MRHSPSSSIANVLVAATLVLVAGCGGGGGDGAFENCGNGVLDGGEQCDDGNLDDGDACLGTCERNVCGDFFIDVGVEQCEAGGQLQGKSCADVGFASGTLACTAQCTFDTSGCTGVGQPPTPTPASTSSGAPTPTSSGDVGTPTPAPTPVGAVCQQGEQIVLDVSLDQTYGAARVDVTYGSSVNLPGTGPAPSVLERAHFAAAGGLTTVNDIDTNADGVDDTLTTSLVGFTDNPAGVFVTVTFDCVAGQPRPETGTFGCTTVSASTAGGVPISNASCTLAVR